MVDYGFDAATPDINWMTRLAEDRPSDWVVLTGDDRIRRNKAERTAWKRARLKGFVFARGFQKTPVHQTAALLLWRWPEMESFVGSAAPGSLFELPIGRSSGFVPLTV